MEKKLKAEAKRTRRMQRKQGVVDGSQSQPADPEADGQMQGESEPGVEPA